MPHLGKTQLTKQELTNFCKSFHKDILCNDLFAYMNEKESGGSARDLFATKNEKNKDIDLDVNMSFLDSYFTTWFKAEKGIAQFIDDKLTNKIFDRFHTRIKLWNLESRKKYRKDENSRTRKNIQKINENITKHQDRSTEEKSAIIRKL